MKFRYIVTDVTDGCIKGTDTRSDALNLAECEDFFVYDTEEGLWLQPEGESKALERINSGEET